MTLRAFLIRSFQRLLATFRDGLGTEEPYRMERPYPWEARYPAGVQWDTRIEEQPVTTLLDGAVATHADAVCTNFRGKRLRYREIDDLVRRAAAGFQALGVGKGSKIGLLLPNCPYSIICYYAVLKAGGTVVNINPLYTARGVDELVADADIRILVTLNLKGLYDKAAHCLSGLSRPEKIIVCPMGGILRLTERLFFDLLKRGEKSDVPNDERHIPFKALIDNDGSMAPVPIDPLQDIAVLQYTGGTTGSPKGAALTHANVYANAQQLSLWTKGAMLQEEKMLGVLPLFHSFGMTSVMNLGILLGAEIILMPTFQTTKVLRMIERERPTIFMGVPTMYSALNECRDIADHDLSSLKYCISGGAPLPVDVQRKFEERAGCALVEGYGLSEAGPVCTVNPLTEPGKPGSVGMPLPGTMVEIASLESPDHLVPPGEKGEICITGPQVMAGYANCPEENATTLRNGRLHTGDVGYLDPDGYVFIVDRIKDLILSSGFNVYPKTVEGAIHEHPAVEEVAVCGIPDRHRGEAIKAFVKCRAGETVTKAELKTFLKERLAPFQMPRRIEFREELPKTLIGKIAKRELIADERPSPTRENKGEDPDEKET